ncbi:hypothetical protein QQZ08_006757 [Neonectria magnoliae]|uniref:Uncharacterized protein n=1 Tax=Neonectria magnoliae TaxID=2732573 RepID=A0ABR1I1E7_9HYPO
METASLHFRILYLHLSDVGKLRLHQLATEEDRELTDVLLARADDNPDVPTNRELAMWLLAHGEDETMRDPVEGFAIYHVEDDFFDVHASHS